MFDAGVLSFHEFAMRDPLPLATIQSAVLEFLQERDDVVLFGAQAVNAYVSEPRMTQDIDLLAVQAAAVAEELRCHLADRFRIAVRVREIGEGRGYRVFQVRKPTNRHLVDVRSVESLPVAQRISQIPVMAPAELVASKVLAYHGRRGNPKAGTDWRDLAMLLLTFPELKSETGPVAAALRAAGADAEVLALWSEIVAQEIRPADEETEF